MKKPTMDKRTFEDIMNDLENKAKFYTPEWNMDRDNPDPGTVLSSIYAHQMEETIIKFNESIDNYHKVFLNLMNPKPLRGNPATVPLVFASSNGYGKNLRIKKGVTVEGHNGLGDKVLFETCDDLDVYPSVVDEVFFISGSSNTIIKGNMIEGKLEISDENIQSNDLYIDAGEVFYSNHPIKLSIKFDLINEDMSMYTNRLTDSSYIVWSYYTQNGWMEFVSSYTGKDTIELLKTTNHQVVSDERGYHIKATVKSSIEEIENLMLRGLVLKSQLYEYDGSIEGFRINEKYYTYEDDMLKPFGDKFNMLSTFDIISSNVLSKKGAIIKFTCDLSFVDVKGDIADTPIDWKMIMKKSELAKMKTPEVSIYSIQWQYYNGRQWSELKLKNPSERVFYKSSEKVDIGFECPKDIAPIYDGEEKRYMIRAEVQRVENEHRGDGIYKVPVLTNPKIYYDYSGYQEVSSLAVQSDLMTSDITDKIRRSEEFIRPFNRLLKDGTSIAIPCDSELSEGELSILFTLKDSLYKELPYKIDVSFLNSNNGTRGAVKLEYKDSTSNLTGTGLVQINLKDSIRPCTYLNKDSSWILISAEHIDTSNIEAIYFNGVYANQIERINDELIDTASDKLVHKLDHEGVTEIEVWVDEFDKLSEKEINELIDSAISCKYTRDSNGAYNSLWVKWEQADTLLDKTSNDRAYVYNLTGKELIFGNGRTGKKPPFGRSGLIKVNLSISMGEKGNINQGNISGLTTSMAFIDSVINPSSGKGGASREDIFDMTKRYQSEFRNRGKLIRAEDFEATIRDRFKEVHHVKCVSKLEDTISSKIGHMTIMLCTDDQKYNKVSDHTKKEIGEFVRTNMPIGMKSEGLNIIDCALLKISVKLSVQLYSHKERIEVQQNATNRIEEFLDTRKGKWGQGWRIGEHPDESHIYKLMKGLHGINMLTDVKLQYTYIKDSHVKELRIDQVKELSDYIVVNGEHVINGL